MSFRENYISIMKKHFCAPEFFTQETISRFELLSRLLMDFNKKVNLTALTDEEGIIAKHFADSLLISQYIPKGAKTADIGCGGGFPTLPLAILRPDLCITAVDSTAKKLDFVALCAKELSLNVVTIPCRAEALGQDFKTRESFDCVTARAVARLNILSELCIPLVKKGGLFISSKGCAGNEEYDEAQKAVSVLGAKLITCDEKTLYTSEEEQKRVIFVFEKISPTDKKYPRNYSQILKKPL